MSLGVKFTKGEVVGFETEDKMCGTVDSESAIQRRRELVAVKVHTLISTFMLTILIIHCLISSNSGFPLVFLLCMCNDNSFYMAANYFSFDKFRMMSLTG